MKLPDPKVIVLMLVFVGLAFAGAQMTGLWLWIMSSGAIPPYEGGAHVILLLIAIALAINGLMKVLTSLNIKE